MRPNMAKMRPKVAKMRLKMAKLRLKMAKIMCKMAKKRPNIAKMRLKMVLRASWTDFGANLAPAWPPKWVQGCWGPSESSLFPSTLKVEELCSKVEMVLSFFSLRHFEFTWVSLWSTLV